MNRSFLRVALSLAWLLVVVSCDSSNDGGITGTGAGITGTPTINVDYCCTTPTDPTTGLNYFPEISISIPPVFSQTSNNELSPAPESEVQQLVSAEIPEEVICQVNVIVTDFETAESAYNSLLSADTFNAISINSVSAGGQEVLYNQNLDDGTNVTGLGRLFYFNSSVDQLALSSIIIADCFGETPFFNQRRTLIDSVVRSIEFDVDTTANGLGTR